MNIEGSFSILCYIYCCVFNILKGHVRSRARILGLLKPLVSRCRQLFSYLFYESLDLDIS